MSCFLLFVFQNTEDRELERVNTLKEALHEFTK